MARPQNLPRLVARLLHGRESTPYDLHRELADKGVDAWLNHLYATMRTMEREGLLRGRWEPSTKGPKRHLYSLNDKGNAFYEEMLRESVETLMSGFMQENEGPLGPHVKVLHGYFQALGIPWPSKDRANAVFAVASYDPLVCYPQMYTTFSKAFSEAKVHVVQPPERVRPPNPRKGISFLDGYRHDMPFKDGYADYVMLNGFPRAASVEETVEEVRRILKPGGHTLIQVSLVMQQGKAPQAASFAEYATTLFYRYHREDRAVDLAEVKRVLEGRFSNVVQAPAGTNVIFHAVRISTPTLARVQEKDAAPIVSVRARRRVPVTA